MIKKGILGLSFLLLCSIHNAHAFGDGLNDTLSDTKKSFRLASVMILTAGVVSCCRKGKASKFFGTIACTLGLAGILGAERIVDTTDELLKQGFFTRLIRTKKADIQKAVEEIQNMADQCQDS